MQSSKRPTKAHKCKVCDEKYQKFSSTQQACSPKCALELVERKKQREFNKETRRLKEKIKSRSDWLSLAQIEFNKYIRLRDADQPCISCNDNIGDKFTGGSYDAGHYRSRGASPELRFHEDNCFKQCKKCNRQYSGNVANMRIGILKRIGQERLDIIEGSHPVRKYTIEEAKEIRAYYRALCKEIMGQRDEAGG